MSKQDWAQVTPRLAAREVVLLDRSTLEYGLEKLGTRAFVRLAFACTNIIGRAGASPPSRYAGADFNVIQR